MPLLMCPNCNASMNEVRRNDVQIDMCPSCRGVWLDRGELEKILATGREQFREFERDREQFYRDPDQYRRSHPQQEFGERGEAGERGERGERGDYDPRTGKRRRGGFEFFDFFD